jgi:rare lipoprotein A (peptidoglycan hydrolase)
MSMRHRQITTLLALLAVAALAPGAGLASAASTGGSAAPAGEAPAGAAAAPTPRVLPTSLATWFGPGFYGQRTACGQTLTPTVVGVANRTLPCGTLIAISYHSRQIVAPVLDRGPYSHIGANWDLTAGAARALGITETVRIHTKIVGRVANTSSLGLPPAATSAGSKAATTTSGSTGGSAAG